MAEGRSTSESSRNEPAPRWCIGRAIAYGPRGCGAGHNLVPMNETFRLHVEALHPAYERLIASPPFKFAALAKQALPERGIYLLTEGDRHLYVGRSDNIRGRLKNHCAVSATHHKATFAFRLAREACGVLKASYKPRGSRADLMTQENFRAAFDAQKARLREVDIRVVEEADPNRQALLEMYVSIALATPYNDFANH